MQQDLQTPGATATDEDQPFWTAAVRRRTLLSLIAVLCLLLVVVVPPYFSVSRYQRRVATAISGALGRPVHFDRISIHVLPIPGLTIENFVVNESPEFGWEPVMRANTVEARLRVSSLWRRRIEVSRISLQSPSINLVRRRSDTRWNLQGILMQASQMNSAPTAQQKAGDAPRFPYIEATDARINIKNGDDKLPFSVKEAEFALWLPEPDEWRVRMVGKPVRTDTDVNDVGLLRVEATLGRAVDLEKAPIDLAATWKPTPLGEAGKLTVGRDTGWRGEASASATLHGTLGAARLVTDLHLLALRRADFFPDHTAEINMHCEAATSGLLRSLQNVRCAVPTNNSNAFLSAVEALRAAPAAAVDSAKSTKPGVLLLAGDVPNVLDWRTASGTASLQAVPANYALAWARLFTRQIPRDLGIGGTFDLVASTEAAVEGVKNWSAAVRCDCILPPPAARPSASAVGATVTRKAVEDTSAPNRWTLRISHRDQDNVPGNALSFQAAPITVSAKEDSAPLSTDIASPVISGELTGSGYMLQYQSVEAVRQAAAVLPSLGSGMPEEAEGTLQAHGAWAGAQAWTTLQSAPRHTAPHRHSKRR